MSYAHADPSESINAKMAPDRYLAYGQTESHTGPPGPTGTFIAGPALIEGTPINRLLIDVSNQPIYWQLKRAMLDGSGRGTGDWEAVEVFMSPGSRVVQRPGIVGIRFRAAVPFTTVPSAGMQAVVTVEAVK